MSIPRSPSPQSRYRIFLIHSGKLPCAPFSNYFHLPATAILIFFFFFLGLHMWHMEVPGLGVYTTATATRDLSRICDLHHSSWQHQVLNPLSEARNRTLILMDVSQVLNPLSHSRNCHHSDFYHMAGITYKISYIWNHMHCT